MYAKGRPLPRSARVGIHLLLLAGILQVSMGIGTLLLHVPVPLAAAHQAGALSLLTVALFVVHRLYKG
jgi:cytochrome c oxidase assembly protein subunit 15